MRVAHCSSGEWLIAPLESHAQYDDGTPFNGLVKLVVPEENKRPKGYFSDPEGLVDTEKSTALRFGRA